MQDTTINFGDLEAFGELYASKDNWDYYYLPKEDNYYKIEKDAQMGYLVDKTELAIFNEGGEENGLN